MPSEPRQLLTCRTSLSEPEIEPPTRSEWPPTYLVSESRVRSAPCLSGFFLQLGGDRRAGCEIDQSVGRVRRRLDQNHADAPLGGGGLRRRAHLRDVEPVGEAEGRDAEGAHLVLQQRLGAAIERARMDDGVARTKEGEAGRGDRRHAAGEDGAFFRFVPDREPILEDFHVGVVEARIDEARFLAGLGQPPARGQVEEVLALLGVLEDEGRGQEDRRLERALRHGRRIAKAHHQRLGMELAVGDAVLVVVVLAHRAFPRRIRW